MLKTCASDMKSSGACPPLGAPGRPPVISPTALKAIAVEKVVRPTLSASPRSPLVMPVTTALATAPQTGPRPTGVQIAVAAI
jgi:hypothetical protein